MTASWISIKQARQSEFIGQTVQVRGWVRTRRDSKGGFSFIEVNDGSCFGNLQIVADGSLANYLTEVTSLSAETRVRQSWSAAQAGKARVVMSSAMLSRVDNFIICPHS